MAEPVANALQKACAAFTGNGACVPRWRAENDAHSDARGDDPPSMPDSPTPISPPSSPIDPDLRAMIAAWPTLPPAIRAGIVAMVAASDPPDRPPSTAT